MGWLSTKEQREKIEFFIKNSLILLGAVFALIFGTSHLAKYDQQQSLQAKLVGDTNILSLEYGRYKTSNSPGSFCYVSGSYQIENIGEYAFVVSDVTIELWEFTYIDDAELIGKESVSYSMSQRILGDTPYAASRVGESVVIPVGEKFGISNFLQRSFGFIIPVNEATMSSNVGSRYVVIANANAAIDDRQPWYSKITRWIAGDFIPEFFENDLRHISKTINICGG
jgi:hypothetical protein